MATEFAMPKLGLTMEEGKVVEWLFPEGATVDAGAAALVVETDKVETEVEAPASGRIHRIAEVGGTYRCGERIALLLDDDESSESGTSDAINATADRNAPRIFSSPNARRVAAALGVDLSTVPGTGPNGRIVSDDVGRGARHCPPPAGEAAQHSQPATAAALQLANMVGVDVDDVVPSSPAGDGRVSRRDVAEHVRQSLRSGNGSRPPAPLAAPAPFAASAPLAQVPTGVIPLRAMRGTIAQRMVSSLQQM